MAIIEISGCERQLQVIQRRVQFHMTHSLACGPESGHEFRGTILRCGVKNGQSPLAYAASLNVESVSSHRAACSPSLRHRCPSLIRR